MKKNFYFALIILVLQISFISALVNIQYDADSYEVNVVNWQGWESVNWTPSSANLIDNDYNTWATPESMDYASTLLAKYYIPENANLSLSQIHVWLYSQDSLNAYETWISGNKTINSTMTTSYWTFGDLIDCDIHNDIGGNYLEIFYESNTETSGGSNTLKIACESTDYSGEVYNYFSTGVNLREETDIDYLYLAEGLVGDNPEGDINASRLYEEEIHWYFNSVEEEISDNVTDSPIYQVLQGGGSGLAILLSSLAQAMPRLVILLVLVGGIVGIFYIVSNVIKNSLNKK